MKLNGIDLAGYSAKGNEATFTLQGVTMQDALNLNGQRTKRLTQFTRAIPSLKSRTKPTALLLCVQCASSTMKRKPQSLVLINR